MRKQQLLAGSVVQAFLGKDRHRSTIEEWRVGTRAALAAALHAPKTR